MRDRTAEGAARPRACRSAVSLTGAAALLLLTAASALAQGELYIPSRPATPGVQPGSGPARPATQARPATPATQATQATQAQGYRSPFESPILYTSPPGILSPEIAAGATAARPGTSTTPGVVRPGTISVGAPTVGLTRPTTLGPEIYAPAPRPVPTTVTAPAPTAPPAVLTPSNPATVVRPPEILVPPRTTGGTMTAPPRPVPAAPQTPATVATPTGPSIVRPPSTPTLVRPPEPNPSPSGGKPETLTTTTTAAPTAAGTTKTTTETPAPAGSEVKTTTTATPAAAPTASGVSEADRERQAEAERARKRAVEAEMTRMATAARQMSQARAARSLGYEDVILPPEVLQQQQQGPDFKDIGDKAKRVGDMARRQKGGEKRGGEKPQAKGDPCAGEGANACLAMARAAARELEAERRRVEERLRALEDELRRQEEQLRREQDRDRRSPERRANKEEKRRLDKQREDLERERERLQNERDTIDHNREVLDELDKDLRQREQKIRESDPNCRSAECRQIREARETNYKLRQENLRQDGLNQSRSAGNIGRSQGWERENADLERRLDAGEGLTRDEWKLRMLRKEAAAAEQERQQLRARADALREKFRGAPPGDDGGARIGESDADRQRREAQRVRDAERELNELDRNIDDIRRQLAELDGQADGLNRVYDEKLSRYEELDSKAKGDPGRLTGRERAEYERLARETDELIDRESELNARRDQARRMVQRHAELKDWASKPGLTAAEQAELRELDRQDAALHERLEGRSATGGAGRQGRQQQRQPASQQGLNQRIAAAEKDLVAQHGATFEQWAHMGPEGIDRLADQVAAARQQVHGARENLLAGRMTDRLPADATKEFEQARAERTALEAERDRRAQQIRTDFPDRSQELESARNELREAQRNSAPGWEIMRQQEKVGHLEDANARRARDLVRQSNEVQREFADKIADAARREQGLQLRQIGRDAQVFANDYVHGMGSLLDGKGGIDQQEVLRRTEAVERAMDQANGAGQGLARLAEIRANLTPGRSGEPSAAERAGLPPTQVRQRLVEVDRLIDEQKRLQSQAWEELNRQGLRARVGSDGKVEITGLDTPFARALVTGAQRETQTSQTRPPAQPASVRGPARPQPADRASFEDGGELARPGPAPREATQAAADPRTQARPQPQPSGPATPPAGPAAAPTPAAAEAPSSPPRSDATDARLAAAPRAPSQPRPTAAPEAPPAGPTRVAPVATAPLPETRPTAAPPASAAATAASAPAAPQAPQDQPRQVARLEAPTQAAPRPVPPPVAVPAVPAPPAPAPAAAERPIAPDPRADFRAALAERIGARFGASAPAARILPELLTRLGDLLDASALEARAGAALDGLGANATPLDFVDELVARLAQEAAAAQSATGAYTGALLRAQIYGGLFGATDAAGRPLLAEAERRQVQARLAEAIDAVGREAGARAAAARARGDRAGELAELARILEAYALPGAGSRDVAPLLRDVDGALGALDAARTPADPEAAARSAAGLIGALQSTAAALPATTPGDLAQALLARLADANRLFAASARQLAAGRPAAERAAIEATALEAQLAEAQARLGLGQPEQALVLLRAARGATDEQATRIAAALASTLQRLEAAWTGLTGAERSRLGDLDALRDEKRRALEAIVRSSPDPARTAIAALALAGDHERRGRTGDARAALESGVRRAPDDPILRGELLRRQLAEAGADASALIEAIPAALRAGAVAVAAQALGTRGDARALETLGEAASRLPLAPEERTRVALQLDLARLSALEAQPPGAARDRAMAALAARARSAAAAQGALDAEVRAAVEQALDEVQQRLARAEGWQRALAAATPPAGGFGTLAREALGDGRLDIAADALVRSLAELDQSGAVADAMRRFAETAALAEIVGRRIDDRTLSEAQRDAARAFHDKVTGELSRRVDAELAERLRAHARSVDIAMEQRAARAAGTASDAALGRAERAVHEALRNLRQMQRQAIEARMLRTPAAEREAALARALEAANRDVARYEELIRSRFEGAGRSVETAENRRILDKLLGDLAALRARRDGIEDHVLDHAPRRDGWVFSRDLNGGMSSRDHSDTARFWRLRDVEMDLNGFSRGEHRFNTDNEARRHGARPRREHLESRARATWGEGDDPNLWRDIALLRDREAYLERRATELVREDRSLGRAQQDERLEQRFRHEAAMWREWGSTSPLLMPELTGIGARERLAAADRLAFVEAFRQDNLARDLELARISGDAQRGFEALVKLREAHLAGQIDAYVDYLNTEWYRRGPVHLKRLVADRAAAQAELEAVVADAARLHAILLRAAHNAVEKLASEDRAYLEERGFIRDGRYVLPDDFRIQTTEAGSRFSERSVVDQIVNAGHAAELLATVVVPGGLSARLARGAFAGMAAREAGAALVRRGLVWGAEKAAEAALFTGFSRLANTALHPVEMLNREAWTLGTLGNEYLHNLAVIGALNVSGSATRAVRDGIAGALGKGVERGVGRYVFEGAADLAALGAEAGTLSGLDRALSGNRITQDSFVGNALTVLMLRGYHRAHEVLSPGGRGEVSQTRRSMETYERWLEDRLVLQRRNAWDLPEFERRALQDHPAARMLRERFGGSWDAARKAYKEKKLGEAEMEELFAYRRQVVDALAREIVAELGGDVKAFGSNNLTSDYDLSFEGPMAEVAVILFNARWTARWGQASGIGGYESAYAADTNVYTKPVYDLDPNLRTDRLAQEGFAHLAVRKYLNDAQWESFRRQVLNDQVRPEVRERLREILDGADRSNRAFEQAIAAKAREIAAESPEAARRPPAELEAAARNRLYEQTLREIVELKQRHAGETSEPRRRELERQMREAQGRALYYASEAYQTAGAIDHVVVNTQAARRQITEGILLGREDVPLRKLIPREQYRHSFFEQYANTFKELNHAPGWATRPAPELTGLATKVAKYFVRALDAARIAGADLTALEQLVKVTAAIEANRSKPAEVAAALNAYGPEGARRYIAEAEAALGRLAGELARAQELPQADMRQAARSIREIRAELAANPFGLPARLRAPGGPDAPGGPPPAANENAARPAANDNARSASDDVATVRTAAARASSPDDVRTAPGSAPRERPAPAEIPEGALDGREIAVADGAGRYEVRIERELGAGSFNVVYDIGSDAWVLRVSKQYSDHPVARFDQFGREALERIRPRIEGKLEFLQAKVFADARTSLPGLDGRTVAIVERFNEVAARQLVNGRMTPGQAIAYDAGIRALNGEGYALIDGHLHNFAFRRLPGADQWRMVIVDTGGIVPARGATPAERAANAREIQRHVDATPEGFVKTPAGNAVRPGGEAYNVAKAVAMLEGPLRRLVDADALGVPLEEVAFKPSGGEIYPEVRRLFAANDNEAPAAYEALRSGR